MSRRCTATSGTQVLEPLLAAHTRVLRQDRGLEVVRVEIALVHAPGIDQVDASDAHGRRGLIRRGRPWAGARPGSGPARGRAGVASPSVTVSSTWSRSMATTSPTPSAPCTMPTRTRWPRAGRAQHATDMVPAPVVEDQPPRSRRFPRPRRRGSGPCGLGDRAPWAARPRAAWICVTRRRAPRPGSRAARPRAQVSADRPRISRMCSTAATERAISPARRTRARSPRALAAQATMVRASFADRDPPGPCRR